MNLSVNFAAARQPCSAMAGSVRKRAIAQCVALALVRRRAFCVFASAQRTLEAIQTLAICAQIVKQVGTI